MVNSFDASEPGAQPAPMADTTANLDSGNGTAPDSRINSHNGHAPSAALISTSGAFPRSAPKLFTLEEIRAACQCGNSQCECHRAAGKVHCPAHDDANPSLSVDGRGGKVLWNCLTGCTQAAVTAALRQRLRPASGPAVAPVIRPLARFDWQRATLYNYCDESGNLLFQVGRLDTPTGKAIRQRRPDGRGGWVWKLGDVWRVLYRLPEVLNAQTVFAVEGEKCADALNAALKAAGLYGAHAATTNPGGAGQWRDEYAAPLTGKALIVLPDNDPPGAQHAAAVCQSTRGAAGSLKLVELPGLAEKGDVADWLAAGHAVSELLDLADAVPQWEPSPPLQPRPSARPTRFNAADLLEMELPEPKFAVLGFIPEGLSILGGKPKLGKSWLMYGAAVAVAAGGVALGSVAVEQGDVLYLALEDTPRRLQARLKKILNGARAPHRLELWTECPRLNKGGLELLRNWLTEHPEARLVVIDTFQKIRPPQSRGGSVYGDDYDAIGALKGLADHFGVAVLVVHHLTKMHYDDPVEAISGSMGLTGAADAILVLRRNRGKADAALLVTGRDIEHEQEVALQWSPDVGSWVIIGDAADYRLSQERTTVLNALRRAGEALSPKEVHDLGVGRNHNALKLLMWSMAKDGQIKNVGKGKYTLLSTNPTNSAN